MFALVNLRRFYGPILLEAADRIGADDALTEVDALMIWRAFGRSCSRVSSVESPEFEHMIKGTAAQRVLADKACASKANCERLRSHARDGTMRKAARGHPLRA